jgi:phage replication initiation protein
MALCTTGVQTAQIAVDWLQWTYPLHVTAEGVRRTFSGPGDWVTLDCGLYGYRRGMRRGDVWVLFDGSENMGVHVQVTGSGWAQLLAEAPDGAWQQFLSSLLAEGVRFTRIDVALDDRAGVLSLDKIIRCVKKGHFVSRFRQTDEGHKRRHTRARTELVGKSVVFGHELSDGRLLIYDKALQQHAPSSWTRVELRLRNARAQSLVLALAEHGESIVPGVLQGYLRFTKPSTSQQRDRWPVQRWWLKFLGNCDKVRLSSAPRPPRNDYEWLSRTAAPALARLKADHGAESIAALIEHGEIRIGLRSHHRRAGWESERVST